ncbi:MICOS complex subunit MIC27-like, partial [Pollicipes pollicipes]|uniref:MICOS complex subunit MIC27-like n=1 Tax=Pollicipes pollicipes TaxID=41117 RepID=UPI0018852750
MFTIRAKSKNGEDPVTLIRPSELPIYEDQEPADEYEYHQRPTGLLEQSVGDLRRALSGFVSQYSDTYDYAKHVYETGKAHSAGTLDYLQDETNLVPRATAITVGGLTGLLVAALRRRGLFKRLMYTGVGLAVPTSICYPQQARGVRPLGLQRVTQ